MKGQLSIEFVMTFTIFLVALVIILGSVNINDITESKTRLEVEQYLHLISNEVNTVYLEGHGYSSSLYLPRLIAGRSYSMITAYNSVNILIDDVAYPTTFITENVTGNFKVGYNKVENLNGEVRIS